MPRNDDDDDDRPRPKKRPAPRDDDDDDDRPRAKRPHRDEDDYDDRPRSRSRRDEGDATGGVIPYKNPTALMSYYCGVFSLIPGLGLILGPIALVLAFLGFRAKSKNPQVKGTGHAIVGMVLGGLVTLGHIVLIILMVVGIFSLN